MSSVPRYWYEKFLADFIREIQEEYGGRWEVKVTGEVMVVRCLWCKACFATYWLGPLSENLASIRKVIEDRHGKPCIAPKLPQGEVGGVLEEVWPPPAGIASPGASESVPSAHEALGNSLYDGMTAVEIPLYAGKKVVIPRRPSNTIGSNGPFKMKFEPSEKYLGEVTPVPWNLAGGRPWKEWYEEYQTTRRTLRRFQVQPKPRRMGWKVPPCDWCGKWATWEYRTPFLSLYHFRCDNCVLHMSAMGRKISHFTRINGR